MHKNKKIVEHKHHLNITDELWMQLNEQAADPILTIDLKGKITFINDAAVKLIKKPKKQILNEKFQVHLKGQSLKKAKECIHRIKKSSVKSVRDQLEITDRFGKNIPVEFTVSPIFVHNQLTQIHISARDVSEKIHLETINLESEKMKALRQFINGTVHEIQNPLKGVLELTKKMIKTYKGKSFEYISYKEFKNMLKTLNTMQDQVNYCYQTTQRLLNLSKKKVGLKGRHCDVQNVLNDVVATLKPTLDVHNISLKTRIAKDLPRVAIGSFELNQVIVNVLTNSIQSLPGGGAIEIKLQNIKDKELVVFECKDDGIGIPKETLNRVFEPFFTTKPRGLEKSSGLGLSIVYSIIQAINGDIAIQSGIRQGTAVKIYLPYYGNSKSNRS